MHINILDILVFKNILDIAIVTILIYLVLELFIQVKSGPIIIGILIISLLYVASIVFNLSLTRMILEPFFGVFLIIMAVIFQRELRRFFEMIGVIGLGRNVYMPKEENFKIISKTIWRLASSKIGALFVFPAREPIDRYLEGGFVLNGQISEPLLLSIFDPTSPGHDGAVIISGDRIKLFAVHLPLAKKFEAVKEFGLRHRAALGISERTNALCVVVSEERGTVAIARNGDFEIIPSKEVLEEKLKSFFNDIEIKQNFNFIVWLRKNFFLIIISLGMAITFWIFFVEK